MGLKSGSSGDPFGDDDEEPPEEEQSDTIDPTDDEQSAAEQPGSDRMSDQPESTAETSTPAESASKPSIPYIYRRSKVNEDRDQVPFFLREHVREGEDDLIDTVEELVGEDVPKSDVREAAMLVAQEHPEFVADKLREWGYDYE